MRGSALTRQDPAIRAPNLPVATAFTFHARTVKDDPNGTRAPIWRFAGGVLDETRGWGHNAMQIGNSHRVWGVVHQAMHWLVVVAVIAQLTLGFTFHDLPSTDPRKGPLFAAHATLGLIILIVMLVRLAWRQAHPVPKLPVTLSATEKKIAIANHWAFYLLLIGLPLGGYLLVNARGHSVPFFGAELPAVLAKNEFLSGLIFFVHAGGAFLLIALIVLHVAAALRHELVLKDNTLRRMTPLPMRDPDPAGEPAARPERRSARAGH
jgi:cytochrome b561